jgi:zinc protease
MRNLMSAHPRIVIAGMLMAFGVLAFNQPVHAQTPASPTKTYRLPNGMEVVLRENHSSPMISSVVLVRSGSKFETDYNNGVTHFLEHLTFDGTASRTQEQISNRVKNLGGYINAFTQKEMIGYLSLVPKEHIAEALDIQQDMVFNSIFPEDRFPKERQIVIEEIRKDADSPDNVSETFHDRWAYQGTPYARPVVGYENLIATVSRDEVIDYYHTFFQPGSMTLLVIGDFDTPSMAKMVEQSFGQHPARPIPTHPTITMPPVVGQTVQRTQAEIGESRVDVHLRLPNYQDPSYVPLNLWSEILSDEAVSPLIQKLTKGDNPPATSVSASLETQAEFSALRISAASDDPKRVDEILTKITETLRTLASTPISDEDIRTVATRLRVADLFLRERLHYYGIMKAPMISVTGYDFVDQLPDRIAHVTPQQLQKAASQYLKGDNYVATIVTPPDTTAAAAPATATGSRTTFLERTLGNGMQVVIKSNPDSRVFAINILGKNRSAIEPTGQEGISDFVNRMLVSGTTTKTEAQIARALASIGADITTNDNPYIPYDDQYTTQQYTFIKFATIDEYAPQGAALLADLVGNANFPDAEVENTRRAVMGLLGMSSGSTGQVCRDLFNASLFGEGPYGKPVMGTMGSVGKFTHDDLLKHRGVLYAPSNIILTCVTGMSGDEAMALLDSTFGKFPTATPAAVTIAPPAAPQGVQTGHKTMQKEQVYIYLGGPIPGAKSADMAALLVANQILSARLGDELREKQGLAYSVGSSVQFDRDFGWMICKMGTGKANYPKARDGILAEIHGLQSVPVGKDELETAQNTLWGSSLTSRLARTNQAYYMGVDEYLGLGYDFTDHMIDKVRAVTAEDVLRVAKQYFPTGNYVLATAGQTE